MNNQNKIKEYRHILTMLESGGDNDEINARTWCADRGYIFDGIEDSIIVHHRGLCASQYVIKTHSIPKVATSLDACVSIQEDGWIYGHATYDEGIKYSCESIKDGYVMFSPKLPTEPLARLYAIILTKIHEAEKEQS